MRLTCTQLVLALAFVGATYALDGNAQGILEQKVTLQLQDQEVLRVLRTIEKQTDARFAFSSRLIQTHRKITINATNETLVSVLNRLLKPLQIEYEVSKGLIMLRRVENTGLITPPTRPRPGC